MLLHRVLAGGKVLIHRGVRIAALWSQGEGEGEGGGRRCRTSTVQTRGENRTQG